MVTLSVLVAVLVPLLIKYVNDIKSQISREEPMDLTPRIRSRVNMHQHYTVDLEPKYFSINGLKMIE